MHLFFTKAVKHYGAIISKHIPLFLAAGMIHMLFSNSGWFPNRLAIDLVTLIYQVMIPLMIGYTAGWRQDAELGGLAGVLATAVVTFTNNRFSIIFAVLLGSSAGFMVKIIWQKGSKWIKPGFEMISKNFIVTLTGLLFAGLSFATAIPLAAGLDRSLEHFMKWILSSDWIFLINILIEPLKIIFFNNGLNHGVLIPLGMDQLAKTGKSLFFLMETNPGPGAGILLALLLTQKTKKKLLLSELLVQFVGGIHEVYFPYILTDLKLLIPLCLGGMTGTAYFAVMKVGLAGPVSPGSILTILIMCRPVDILTISIGLFLSAAVSCFTAVLILKYTPPNNPVRKTDLLIKTELAASPVKLICVVCDAGMGSSAMGAALLRRQLKAQQITSVLIKAAAVNEIPQGCDLIVCQRDFLEQGFLDQTRYCIYSLTRLTDIQEYEHLINKLKLERRIL